MAVAPSTSSSSSSSSGEKRSSSLRSKQVKMDYLKKQLNKSYQEKKLVTTGFSLSKEEANSKKSNNLVLVKPKSTPSESNTSKNSNNNSAISGLVSNDYGSDESDSN